MEEDVEVTEDKDSASSPPHSPNSPQSNHRDIPETRSPTSRVTSHEVDNNNNNNNCPLTSTVGAIVTAQRPSDFIVKGNFSIASILGMQNSKETAGNSQRTDANGTITSTHGRKNSDNCEVNTSRSMSKQEEHFTAQVMKARYLAEMLTARGDHIHNASSLQQTQNGRDLSMERELNRAHSPKHGFTHGHNLTTLYSYYGENGGSHIRADDVNVRLWQDLFLSRRSGVPGSALSFPYSLQARNLYLQQKCRAPLQALYIQQQQQRNLHQRKLVSSAALLQQLCANDASAANRSRSLHTNSAGKTGCDAAGDVRVDPERPRSRNGQESARCVKEGMILSKYLQYCLQAESGN